MKSIVFASLLLLGMAHAQAAVVDNFILDMNSANGLIGVNSNIVLNNGQTYEVQVSGTFEIGCVSGGCPTDAEYYVPVGGPFPGVPFNLTGFDSPTGTDVGVRLDNIKVNWGAFNAARVYTASFLGLGSTLFVNYLDTNYGDNRGSLNISISTVSPSAVPVPAALPLFLSGLAALGWLRRRIRA